VSDVNQLISLGIGSPADIYHFVLFGLTPAGEVVFVPVVIVEGVVQLTQTVAAEVTVVTTVSKSVKVEPVLSFSVEIE
jgi:hypothetical protein